MKWSKEINKTGSCWNSSGYFPRHRSLATNGYCAGKAIVMHEMALKNLDEGLSKCPFCGSSEVDEANMEITNRFATYNGPMSVGSDMYTEVDCTCKHCGKDRQLYCRANTGEAIMVYDTDR